MNPAFKTVTLAVGPIFGSRWLVPRLAKFRTAHPRIELVLHESPRITDAAMMTSHLAVDWGTGDWSGPNSQKLLDITYSPIVRADLVDACDGFKEPSDLTRIPLIHQRDKSEWSAWFKLAGVTDFQPVAETTIRDSTLCCRRCLTGRALRLAFFPLSKTMLKTRGLLKPFDIDLIPQRSFYLLSRPSSPRTREVSNVQNWLLDEAAGSFD